MPKQPATTARSRRRIAALGVIAVGALFGAIALASQASSQTTSTETRLVANPMLGANETPTPGDTEATGKALVAINTAGQVCINLQTTGLDGDLTMLHIHEGAAGVAGPVRVDFAVTSGKQVAKCVQSTAPIAAAIIANPSGFYVNGHTAGFPDGAFRAQLAPSDAKAGDFVLLPQPLRAYDSRAVAEGKVAASQARTIDLSQGRDGANVLTAAVPAGARAAMVILTITQTEGSGFGTLYSAAVTLPATSTINWTQPNSDIASTTTVAVDGSSKVIFRSGQNATHVIVDVLGYYV